MGKNRRETIREPILKKIRGHGRAIGLPSNIIECFCGLYDFWEAEEEIEQPMRAYTKISRMMDAKKLDMKQRKKAEELKEAAEEPEQDKTYIDEQL